MDNTVSNNTPKTRFATRVMFLSAGMITAAWASIIPFVKYNVQISDGVIGGLLLCLGAGALAGMPLAGVCSDRFGCKPILITSVISFALLFLLIPMMTTVPALAFVLFLFGMSIGLTDCAMNLQAVVVEKASDKPLMSGFHGFYSLGGMVGALVMTVQLSMDVPVLTACLVTSALVLALLLYSQSGLLRNAQGTSGPLIIMPRSVVVLIGVVCSILFLSEGTVLDWSGIYLAEFLHVDTSKAGLGVASFSIAMTIGRLTGDRIVSSLGPRKVINAGALTAISGFLITLHTDMWQLALFGYALIGFGCANIVPIMFSATGKQDVMPESMAVTAVSTLGYAGVLAGPALVGFGAEVSSLPVSLHAVVGLMIVALLVSLKIRV